MTFPRERFRRGVQLCDGDIEVLLVTLGQPPRSRNSLLPHFQLRAANVNPPLIAPSMIGAVLTSSMGLLGATLNLSADRRRRVVGPPYRGCAWKTLSYRLVRVRNFKPCQSDQRTYAWWAWDVRLYTAGKYLCCD
jgi:hypothetical protein